MPENVEPDQVMDEESPKPAPKKGGSKVLIMGVPVVLISIVAAYFVVVKFVLPKMPEPEKSAKQETQIQKKPNVFGFVWGYKDQTITLWDGRRSRYCVLGITFETDEELIVKEILPPRESQIRDLIRATISMKTMEQLNNPLFQEDTLKSEILAKVNEILPEGKTVRRIFIDSFIIQ